MKYFVVLAISALLFTGCPDNSRLDLSSEATSNSVVEELKNNVFPFEFAEYECFSVGQDPGYNIQFNPGPPKSISYTAFTCTAGGAGPSITNWKQRKSEIVSFTKGQGSSTKYTKSMREVFEIIDRWANFLRIW